jgi:hypothetical protein
MRTKLWKGLDRKQPDEWKLDAVHGTMRKLKRAQRKPTKLYLQLEREARRLEKRTGMCVR